MRRLLAWIGAAFGGIALYRALTRRGAHAPAPADGAEERLAPGADARADELRRKLEESRAVADEQGEADDERETPVDRAEPAGAPDERRREVHERAREAVERMRGADPEA